VAGSANLAANDPVLLQPDFPVFPRPRISIQHGPTSRGSAAAIPFDYETTVSIMEEKKRILISDCDEEVLIALEHWLEDQGFDTTTAWSTEESLRLLNQKDFDLVLAADHPPELDCEILLRNAPGKGIPVVALASRPRHPFAEQRLLALGAQRVVHKWEPSEVQRAVEDLINSAQAMPKRAVAGTRKVG
jgi:CheY-like chemotaxis protein